VIIIVQHHAKAYNEAGCTVQNMHNIV
jgi:hypothetical protein